MDPVQSDKLTDFAEKVREEVNRSSLESALCANALEIGSLASTESGATDLQRHVRDWMLADSVSRLSLPSPRSVLRPLFPVRSVQKDRRPDAPIDGVVEADGNPVKVYYNEQFENWGGTVRNVPRFTFVPYSRVGIVNIVKYARAQGLRVRASGARHSWSDMYGASGEVLVSMMELDAADPRPFKPPIENPVSNELEKIELVHVEDGGQTALVKIGGAATLEHFRLWALEGKGEWNWMISALPLPVETTFSGNASLGCHGAGINHGTVSDFIVELEIVNCRGEIQIISDTQQVRAAAGCFGLLGIIVSQTFRCNRLRIARMFPRKTQTPIAVPPVSRDDVPINDDFDVARFSDADLESATKVFYEDVTKFYSEWAWFPFNDECWTNCWDTEEFQFDGSRPGYPSPIEVKLQKARASVADLFQKTALRLLPAFAQAKLLGKSTMAALPGGQQIIASVNDAVHLLRGLHHFEIRDFEMEIPIPKGPDGLLDFSVCQKAWWMAIDEIYKELEDGRVPVRVALEMRVMGGSNVLLACQRGNNATCAIQTFTNTLVGDREWMSFIQRLSDRWATLKDPVTEQPLVLRPHWAKDWPPSIRGLPVEEYLKKSYEKSSEEFRTQIAAIAKDGKYSIEDALRMFGNNTILNIIGLAD